LSWMCTMKTNTILTSANKMQSCRCTHITIRYILILNWCTWTHRSDSAVQKASSSSLRTVDTSKDRLWTH
jgi:hypothetical protein